MPISWHVDGKTLHVNDDWEASSTAAGGYEQFTATADREDVRHVHQGSRIHAYTSGGKEVWYGILDATPAVSRLDTVGLTATGPVSRLRRQRSGRLYQSRDYGAWKPQDSDPHNYGASGRIQVDGQGGRLVWNTTVGTDIKTNNEHGFVAWFPGEPVNHIAFDWTSQGTTTDYTMRVGYAAGPSAMRTQSGADISLNATSGSVDRALSTGDADDMAYIKIIWDTANATTATHYRLRVTNLRVNGRASGDDVSPGQIIGDLGRAAGLDETRVHHSGMNALPFYWEGGSWADAVDELAALDDWPWAVNRNALVYDRWDPGWHLQFGKESEDLDFVPIYNSVRVFYTTLAGAPRSVRAEASPDPLKRWGADNEYQYDLSESYSGDEIPTAVANAILEQVSRQRVVGTVEITHGRLIRRDRIWTPRRRSTHSVYADDHYLTTPGSLAHLTPYPDLAPQRITGVRLRSSGVTVEFGQDATDAALRVLARTALARSRRKPKKP